MPASTPNAINTNDLDVLQDLIDAEYQGFNSSILNSKKASHLNNIIQLKVLSNKFDNSLSLDIKNFTKYYILSADEHTSGYDEILLSKITDNIVVKDLFTKLSLHKHASKLLKSNGYENQHEDCELIISDLKRQIFWKKRNAFNLANWIYITITRSKLSITISLILCILVCTIVLLPAHNKGMVSVTFETNKYTNIFFVDRVLNTLSLMLGLDDSVKVAPVNFTGFLIVFFGKLLFLVIVGNILIKQFMNKINLD